MQGDLADYEASKPVNERELHPGIKEPPGRLHPGDSFTELSQRLRSDDHLQHM